MSDNPKIWIIGSHGMLGKAFCRFFSQKEIPYLATDKDDVDITSPSQIKAFAEEHNCYYWINCAAYTSVDKAESDREMAMAINAVGVEYLAKAASTYKRKLIHFSTDYVFDGKKDSPYLESDKPSPLSTYGQSKLEGEKLLFTCNDNALVIRLSWLFSHEGTNFVTTMVRLMQEKEELHVVCDQRGRPTYCDDAVPAVWQLRDQKGIFHIAGSTTTDWHAYACEIKKLAKETGFDITTQMIHPIRTEEYNTPAKRPLNAVLSTHKAEGLGIHLPAWKISLQNCLSQLKQKTPA